MKTLYVNLGNEQIESTKSTEVLNYKLLDDFFFYLGEAIVEGIDFHANKISLIEEFNTPKNASDFDEILKQWEKLKSILFGEKPKGIFDITLPNGYINWLRYNSNDEYRKIYSFKYSNSDKSVVSIDIDDFFTSCIEGDLLRKINSYVVKNQQIDNIVLGVNKIVEKSFFIEEVRQRYHAMNVYCSLNNITFAKKDGKWGCIDKNGNIVIPFIYDDVWYNGGIIKYKNEGDGNWKNIEINGRLLAYWYDYPYLYVTSIYNSNEHKEDFLDSKGNVITSYKCGDRKSFFSCGFIGVERNGKWGFIDINGNALCPFEFHYVKDFENGFAVVARNAKHGVIDTKGIFIVPLLYEDCSILQNGLFAVKEEGKWGVVDLKENKVVPLAYDYVYHSSEGLIGVKKNGKCGFLNLSGKVTIPLIYDYVGAFFGGMAVVRHEGKSGVIDLKGNLRIPFIYESIHPFNII